MFETNSLLQDNDIRHGFFGADLNVSYNAGGDPAIVDANRAVIAERLGAVHLLTVSQCHSADCVTVSVPFDGAPPQADALVSDRPGLAIGVLTADCAPVLFLGRKANGAPVIGAAHAGWRGAVGGVLENTIQAMRGLGADDICAVIGPCIGPESYEVGDEFSAPFLAEDHGAARFFTTAAREGHFMFDLPGYCAYRLTRAGVVRNAWVGHDTCARADLYFSHRRTSRAGEDDRRRQLSALIIV